MTHARHAQAPPQSQRLHSAVVLYPGYSDWMMVCICCEAVTLPPDRARSLPPVLEVLVLESFRGWRYSAMAAADRQSACLTRRPAGEHASLQRCGDVRCGSRRSASAAKCTW
eukprot:scaffold22550_cov163-Isochrysis_galbana.AAC.2